MSTDGEILRQAAILVRATGEKATKGVCPNFTWTAVRHIERNCDVHLPEDCSRHECHQWDRYDDSPWIALMDATLAEPLAAWLEDAADEAERVGTNPAALAAARTLLAAPLPS